MSYDPLTTTSPVYTGPRVLSYPFANDGDLTHVVAEQKYIVQAESYTPPALNTTITVNAVTLYLVGDYNHSEIESGCINFVRRWASIPATRTRPGGTRAFTYPGLTPAAGGASKTITAVTFSQSITTATIVAHGYTAGQTIMFRAAVTFGSQFRMFTTRLVRVIAAPTVNTFTVPVGLLGYTFVSGSAQAYTPAVNPRTEPASSVIQYDYALPGVSAGIASFLDLEPTPEFRVVGAVAEPTVENVLTPLTSPTVAEYLALIGDSSLIVAESFTDQYMGDIIVRKTTLVRAK